MLTPDMKQIIEEQLLGFVATTAPDGTPNVSPKGTFFVVDDETIAFGEIRSPGTIRNLRTNSRIEINFVDPFVRKGYRFAGTAIVVERGTDTFDTLLGCYRALDRECALLWRSQHRTSLHRRSMTTESGAGRQTSVDNLIRKLQPNERRGMMP